MKSLYQNPILAMTARTMINAWIMMLTGTFLVFGLPHNSHGETVLPEEQWQEAAINYEYAAEAQETAADNTLKQANQLHNETPENMTKMKQQRIQAANLKLRASDLLAAASTNRDHAARTWRRAATTAGRNAPSHNALNTNADKATQKATRLLQRAAELAEKAALSFAIEEELLSQAAAHHKAAGLRERLAARR